MPDVYRSVDAVPMKRAPKPSDQAHKNFTTAMQSNHFNTHISNKDVNHSFEVRRASEALPLKSFIDRSRSSVDIGEKSWNPHPSSKKIPIGRT